MKRILLVIILLSIAHVATAQHQRKNDPVQKAKQKAANQVKSQTDGVLRASENNMINSKNPNAMGITPSVPPVDPALKQVLNSPHGIVIPMQHIVPIPSGERIRSSRNESLKIDGFFTKIRANIKIDSIDKACSLLERAMFLNREYSWLLLQQLSQEGIDQVTPLLHAYADILAERNLFISYDELNLVLESFHERKKYKELIELYNNNKQKVWYSTYAPLYLCASIGYLETGDMKNAVKTYQKFKNMFDPMDESLGSFFIHTFDSHTIENLDNRIQGWQEIPHLESAYYDRRLR